MNFNTTESDDAKRLIERAQGMVDDTGLPHGIYLRRQQLLVLPLNRWGFKDPSLTECVLPVTHSPRSNKV